MVIEAQSLRNSVLTLPDSAFTGKGKRKALEAQIRVVEGLVERAEGARKPSVRDALLRAATAKLTQQVLPRMDGCVNGTTSDDWITDCDFQADVLMLGQELLADLEGRLPSDAQFFDDGSPQEVP